MLTDFSIMHEAPECSVPGSKQRYNYHLSESTASIMTLPHFSAAGLSDAERSQLFAALKTNTALKKLDLSGTLTSRTITTPPFPRPP